MKFLRIALYLFLLVLIGGAGCWIALGQHITDPIACPIFQFLGNLGTFAISVAVMAFADFLLLPNSSYGSTKSLCLYVVLAASVSAGVIAVVWKSDFSIYIGTTALGLCLLEWVIVNLSNPNFDETSLKKQQSILGGEIS